MATRIAEIFQFSKFLDQNFIFVSLNKLRISITIQQLIYLIYLISNAVSFSFSIVFSFLFILLSIMSSFLK